jgi:hypothetical protein
MARPRLGGREATVGVRVEISRRITVELLRKSFILYIDGERQAQYGYENAGDFAAALDRVLRSDEFRDWLSRRLQSLSPYPAEEPDRE